MHSLVRSIVDFRILTITKQQSFFEDDLPGVFCLNSALGFRDSGMINSSECLKGQATVYNMVVVTQGKHLNNTLNLDSLYLSNSH
jgi:hypothetical protein